MSSHTNSSFLNSCVKVPIDPCNRCPAPTFGRPLIYYGKDKECSKRKKKCKKKSLSGEGLCDSERKSKEALQNLKSFYHSIPGKALGTITINVYTRQKRSSILVPFVCGGGLGH